MEKQYLECEKPPFFQNMLNRVIRRLKPKMAIICDNCKVDLTPDYMDEEHSDKNIVSLNGGKKCLCTDCFIVLSDWACSDEHRKALEQYKKEAEKQNK